MINCITDLQRDKDSIIDADAEVEMGSMGSFHDSKDEEESEDIEEYIPANPAVRAASKESINDRYTANTLTHTTPTEESDNDTTDTFSTFPNDDTASDDFFISRTPLGSSARSSKNTPHSPKSSPKKREDYQSGSTDSASDDFFITVDKVKSATSIIQGNGVILAPPVLPKSNSAIIRGPSEPHKERKRDRKGSDVKAEEAKKLTTGTDTEEDLEDIEEFEEFEDFENLAELPEFSDVYDSSISGPAPHDPTSPPFVRSLSNRSISSQHQDRANSPQTDTSTFGNAINARDPSRSNHAPTRVLPMGPSSISLLSAQLNAHPLPTTLTTTQAPLHHKKILQSHHNNRNYHLPFVPLLPPLPN
jgi:hypothetical protein